MSCEGPRFYVLPERIDNALDRTFERAKNGLEDAQIALCGAVTAHAEAKRALEVAEAVRLCEGVDGRNERERAARLRLELSTEHIILHEAEDALTDARCGCEVARLEWEMARYSVRALIPPGGAA